MTENGFATTYTEEDAVNKFRELQSQYGGDSTDDSDDDSDDDHGGPRKKHPWSKYFNNKLKQVEAEFGLNSSGVSDESGQRYIPIFGSSLDADDAYGRGDIWTGHGHMLLAISDVFLIKSLFVGIGKSVFKKGLIGGTKRYFGLGMSHEYGATVSRLKRLGVNMSGFKHHWFITQKMMKSSPWLKKIGNQSWNLTRFSTQASHMRWAHGQRYFRIKYPFTKVLYPLTSTPTWFKLTTLYGSRLGYRYQQK